MSATSQNRLSSIGPFFISARTHFTFIKRMFNWGLRYSSSFAEIFISFAKKIPLIGQIIILLGFILDILAFGTNTNNSKFSQVVAFLGYAALMLLSTFVFIYPSFAGAAIVSSFGLMISMYFEGITILTWFDNFKNLEWKRINNEPMSDLDYENAHIMFNAATITFFSMLLKGLALSISTFYPAAALAIVVIAQIAEFSAMLGTLGKEKVNLSQNFKPEVTDKPEAEINSDENSFKKIMKPLQKNKANFKESNTKTTSNVSQPHAEITTSLNSSAISHATLKFFDKPSKVTAELLTEPQVNYLI